MGVDSTFTCLDCKIKCYLGYGSYKGSLTHCKTLEEFDTLNKMSPPKAVNAAFREMLSAHEGHNWMVRSSDYTEYRGNDLWYVDPMDNYWDKLLIEDYKNFKDITPEGRK